MCHVSHVTGHVSFSFLVVGGASWGLPHPFLKLGVTLSVSDHGNCQCSAQFDAKADGDQFWRKMAVLGFLGYKNTWILTI